MPDIKPLDNPYTDKLVEFSIQYYKDFVEPNKKYKKPTDDEKKILQELVELLKKCKINNITIVTGSLAKKIKIDDVSYVKNKFYRSTEQNYSIFAAKKKLNGSIIFLISSS